MKSAQIATLKNIAAIAFQAHESKKQELIAAGFKSNERYEMLKDLKEVSNKTHAEYAKFAKKEINSELNKIIAADLPRRQAAARARSPWKQAKYEAANASKSA